MGTYSLETPLGKVEITKLNEHNYERWSRQVKNGLVAIDAWQIITGDLAVPGKDSDEEERKRYHKLNDKGFALIYNSVHETQQVVLDKVLDSCTTAWKMLEMLHSKRQPEEENLVKENRFLYGSESERAIEKWRTGRVETVSVGREWLGKLESLDDTCYSGQVGSTLFRVAGNAMIITGSLLEIFYPPARLAGGTMKAYGRACDVFGVASTGLIKLAELGLSKWFLSKVNQTFKEDAKNTNELLITLFVSGDMGPKDMEHGLSAFFRKRNGRKKCRDATTDHGARGIPAWKVSAHLIGMPVVEYCGEDGLRFLGVQEAYCPLFLNGAFLAWNMYYLLSTRGQTDKAQYVQSVEAVLLQLEEELESSLKGTKEE